MVNVVLLFGGQSVEHDISCITHKQVVDAIDSKKYQVKSVYLDKNNNFFILKKEMTDIKNQISKCNLRKLKVKRKNKDLFFNNYKVDVVINCIHGKGLEDGTISGFLDLLNVSYTSPSLESSIIFHNKFYAKLILNKYNINTVDYEYVNKYQWNNNQNEVLRKLNRFNEVIVKPVNLGSSVGVILCNKKDLSDAIDSGFKYDAGVLIEKKLNKFLELNQAFYVVNGEIVISKIEEVKNNSTIYDFKDKYENDDITRVVPAKLSNQLRSKITKTTKKIGQIYNSKGVMRVDYLYDLESEILYVNEVNVIPGALSFYLFEAKNIYFQTLIDDLIKEAKRSKIENDNLIKQFNSNVLNKKNNKLK